jgi:hypothetical protein
VLRDRPDAHLDVLQDGTPEPGVTGPAEERNRTNELPPRTSEPERAEASSPEAKPESRQPAPRTPEPGPRLNRHQRRALAAMTRGRAA